MLSDTTGPSDADPPRTGHEPAADGSGETPVAEASRATPDDVLLRLLTTESPVADQFRGKLLELMHDLSVRSAFGAGRADPDREDPAMALLKELLDRLHTRSADFWEEHFCRCPHHPKDERIVATPPADEPGTGSAEPEGPSSEAPVPEPGPDAQPDLAANLEADPSADTQPTEDTESDPRPGNAGTSSDLMPLTVDWGWRSAVDELRESSSGRRYLGRLSIPDDLDDGLLRAHLALLRLPVGECAEWQDRLQRFVPPLPSTPPVTLPGLDNESPVRLLPALPTGPEVRVSAEVRPPEWFDQHIARAEMMLEAYRFAVLAAQVLFMAKLDDSLLDATGGRSRDLASRPGSDEVAYRRYADLVLERFRLLAQTRRPGERLRYAVQLDEMLRSLLHTPVSAEDSWWGGVRQSSLQLVKQYSIEAERAGLDVDVQALTGVQKTAADAGLCESARDVPMSGTPDQVGKIATCLRLYLRIDAKKYPGRVLYYAP